MIRPHVVALITTALIASVSASERKLPDGVDSAKHDWYGEFYNENEFVKCKARDRNPANVACEYFRLTRVEEPEYWPYSNVPNLKLPEAPNPPVYRSGMSSKEYFAELCRAEAGEFVYKVVDNVEAIYQIRPRKVASWEALHDRYVMEDPYGYTRWEAENPETIFVRGPFATFKFFESPVRHRKVSSFEVKRYDPSITAPPPADARFERFFGFDGRDLKTMRKEYDVSLKSRFGFTWRGIKRPHDRELSIAGGELIVLDLRTGEVLGIRRGFARSGFVRNSRSGIQWETAQVCPRLRKQTDGWDKTGDFAQWFVRKVLRPADASETK